MNEYYDCRVSITSLYFMTPHEGWPMGFSYLLECLGFDCYSTYMLQTFESILFTQKINERQELNDWKKVWFVSVAVLVLHVHFHFQYGVFPFHFPHRRRIIYTKSRNAIKFSYLLLSLLEFIFTFIQTSKQIFINSIKA